MNNIGSAEKITAMAKALYREEKAKKRLDGWFLAREIVCDHAEEYVGLSREMRAAKELEEILQELPLSISDNAVFAGSQSDAFARSYALINPAFRVETFSGYCDPTAVYGILSLTRNSQRSGSIVCANSPAREIMCVPCQKCMTNTKITLLKWRFLSSR